MKKILRFYLPIALLILLCTNSFSQGTSYEDIALQASRSYFGGTARSMGMGGAFGALGGDLASLTTNPAGVGEYIGGEYSITPSILSSESQSSFFGSERSDNKTKFNFNGAGLVFSLPTFNSRGITQISLAASFNRLADFHNSTIIAGENIPVSPTDAFASDASNFDGPGVGIDYLTLNNSNPNIGNPGIWNVLEAWETGLIGRDVLPDGSLASSSYSSVLAPGELTNQEIIIEEKGYIDQYDFAIGVNINNVWNIGLGIGVQEFSYTNRRYTSERFFQESPSAGFDRYEYLHVSGAGLNLRLGTIYSPIPQIRLGVAVQTPTWFNLDEDYYLETSSSIADAGSTYPGDPDHPISGHSSPLYASLSSYNLRTPFRVTPSIAYIFARKTVLSIDYEYADYANIQFSEADFNDNFLGGGSFDESNESIDDLYSGSHTLRVGMETPISRVLSARAGYAFYSSPVSSKAIAEGAGNLGHSIFYTLGLGAQFRSFYLDFAYVYNYSSYNSYSVYGGATTDLRYDKQRFALTFGLKI